MTETLKRLWSDWILGNRKNSHLEYYLHNIFQCCVPRCITQAMRTNKIGSLKNMTKEELQYVMERVDYYCKLSTSQTTPTRNIRLSNFSYLNRRNTTCGYIHSIHFLDTYAYTRYFQDYLHIGITTGDVSTILPEPHICKSRPITFDNSNQNNVILKLNKLRHFFWINDPFRWEEKECRILFRGNIKDKPRRKKFIDLWKNHEWCDVKAGEGLPIYDHLKYRYIMALEGNDVASNLKWVMSSNSIAVMPRPTCETWFMEGKLIPDYHYIEIASDYHDLIEKIDYYEQHPEKAKTIINNAHQWCKQFHNNRREDLISLLVLDKYFKMTGQLPIDD